MKNEGGREAGKCSKVVPDRGDRCPSSFLQRISVSDLYEKSKQISIATLRYPILTVACFPTPLLFHYPLPLTKQLLDLCCKYDSTILFQNNVD
jgi:hypothetical protein